MSSALYETTRVALETRFKNGWGSRTPVQWPNVAFAQPANTAYVVFTIRFGAGSQRGLGPAGTRLERHVGFVFIQIFTPKNSGTKAAHEHADFAANIFRMASIAPGASNISIELRTPSVADQPDEKEMTIKLLSLEFQADGLF